SSKLQGQPQVHHTRQRAGTAIESLQRPLPLALASRTAVPEPITPTAVAAHPVATLLATVRRTGLLAPATLAEVEARPEASSDDPKPLGRYLFQNGYLTRYQLTYAASGRDEDLVVGPYLLLDR